MAAATSRPAWRLAAALAACALALSACSEKGVPDKAPAPGDQAVAKVLGHTVWASDVKREAVAQGLIGEGEPLDASSDLFRKVLDEVVDQKLLASEATRRKLDKDPAAQRRLAAARDRALENLLVESVVGRAVTPEAENSLYQEFLTNRTPSEEIRIRQILLATEADADQVKKLLAGGASFDAVALERSKDDATRYKGGDMGPQTTDSLPEAIANAVRGVKVGQLIGPVQVDGGWALLRVDDRHPEAPPAFDAVKPQIIRFLTYDQVKDLVLRLRGKARIETLLAPPPDVPGRPTEPASAPPQAAVNAAAANAAGAAPPAANAVQPPASNAARPNERRP